MMKCTNVKCQAVLQPVHPECFEQLETNLIKILGTLGKIGYICRIESY